MHVNLLIWPFGELRKAIANCADLSHLRGPAVGVIELTWPSKDFERLMSIWKGIPFATARTTFSFSAEEMGEGRLFEVWDQTTGYSITDVDRDYFRNHLLNGPCLKSQPIVRYFEDVRLSKPLTKPKQISGLDASVPVFFIDQLEAAAWEEQRFEGLGFGAVRRHRGSVPLPGLSLIVPKSVMSPMVAGANVVVSHVGEFEQHHTIGYSVFSREAIDAACDFNFMSEPTFSFGYPRILVSRRFYDFYNSRGLTGWRMRPVIEFGSSAHSIFLKALNLFLADWDTGHKSNRLVGP